MVYETLKELLNLAGDGRMITVQTNLSALVAVTVPAGGEMSGLTAHFLFGAKGAPNPKSKPGADTSAARPLVRRCEYRVPGEQICSLG